MSIQPEVRERTAFATVVSGFVVAAIYVESMEALRFISIVLFVSYLSTLLFISFREKVER